MLFLRINLHRPANDLFPDRNCAVIRIFYANHFQLQLNAYAAHTKKDTCSTKKEQVS